MINDETKRKLRELNMPEIIAGLEIQQPEPRPSHGLLMTVCNGWLIMYIRRNTTTGSNGWSNRQD